MSVTTLQLPSRLRQRPAVAVRLPRTVAGGSRRRASRSGDVVVAGLVFLLYSRVLGTIAERAGVPSPLQPLLLVAFVWTWWRAGGSPRGWRAAQTFVLGSSLFVLSALPSLARDDPSPTVAMLVVLMRDVVVVAAMVYVVVAHDAVRAAVWGMIAALALLSVTTVLDAVGAGVADGFWGLARTSEQLISDVEEGDRAIGPYEDPNFYAQALVILLAPALERARRAPTRRGRRIAGAVAVCGAVAVAMTYSRGGVLALGVIVGYQVWRDPPRLTRLLGVAALAVLAIAAIAPVSVVERVTSVRSAWPAAADESTDVSIRGRASEALAAVAMFRDEPLGGVGYGAYDRNYVEYSTPVGLDPRREERAAHSLYLEIAAELGLVGVVGAAGAAAVFWGASRRRVVDRVGSPAARSLAIGLRAAVLGFAATAVFLHDVHPRPWMLVLGLAVAAGQLPVARRPGVAEAVAVRA